MNEAWEKHIQPIINSPGFEHSNWIWDPFLKKYPQFSDEQRIQVEDTLLLYSFDSFDKDLSIKALGIAEILQNSKIASKRFSSKMKDGLRKFAQNIYVDIDVAEPLLHYYVFAFATFGVKEAIPYIKSILQPLKARLSENPFYLKEQSYHKLFRACCIALLQLGDSEARSLFAYFIVNDVQMMVVSPNHAMWVFTDLASFWDYIGVSGFKEIVVLLQTWQKERLAIVLPLLKEKTEQMRYRSTKEKQDVFRLVGDLESYVAEA